jgi:hypothetical protein
VLLLMNDLKAAEKALQGPLNAYPEEPLFVSLNGMLRAPRDEPEAAIECARRAFDTAHVRSFGHTHHTLYQVACIFAITGERPASSGVARARGGHGVPMLALLSGGSLLEQPAAFAGVQTLRRRDRSGMSAGAELTRLKGGGPVSYFLLAIFPFRMHHRLALHFLASLVLPENCRRSGRCRADTRDGRGSRRSVRDSCHGRRSRR